MPALRHDEPFRSTTLLTAKTTVGRRRRRRLVIGSVVFHVVLLVVVIIISPRRSMEEDELLHFDIVFQSPVEPEPEPIPPEPKPIPRPKVKPPEPRPAPEQPKAPPPPVVVTRPKPVRAAVPARPRPERTIQKAVGFEVAAASAPRPRDVPRVVSSGSFGEATAAVSKSKALPLRAPILGTGFDSAAQPERSGGSRHRGSVTNPGFDSIAVATSPKQEAPGVVKQAGFGDGVGVAQPPRRQEMRQPIASLDTPVEIVSKPKPTYTDEARELRLEGEVVVEVTFIASGQLRVLRVLEGLGHGLDEAAVAAVRQIRFTPARRDGRPVDQTATLRVVFRLA